MFTKNKKQKVVEFETEFDAHYGTDEVNSYLSTKTADEFKLHPRDYSDKGIDYKFDEAKLIDEFKEYVDATYNQHYAKDKFQATEFIIDGGHGMGFCIGNVLKYAQRYGKKGSHTDARKDLLKVLHYGLMALYVHDQMDEQE
jgi:hypothetical protein